MVYQPKNAVGYKNLITWKQAERIYHKTKDFVRAYLTSIDERRLTNHLVDSARSVQRNIEEGYKRATTKEYVEFLGFSRASLEELKGDFEELKREYREGIRREREGTIREREGEKREREGIRRERKGEMREIAELLDLIYGEDCMMGRQINGLERKMLNEKTLPRSEMIKRVWRSDKSANKKFWDMVETKYGLIRDKSGRMIKVENGKEGIDKGREGIDRG